MEERFIYPDDNVVPIEIGDGYKDYLLSNLLPNHKIVSIDGRVYQRVDSEVLLTVFFIVKDSSEHLYWQELYPVNYCSNRIISQDVFLQATDIVVRVFEKDVRWVRILSVKDTALELEGYALINHCLYNPWCLSAVADMTLAAHDSIRNGNGLHRLFDL